MIWSVLEWFVLLLWHSMSGAGHCMIDCCQSHVYLMRWLQMVDRSSWNLSTLHRLIPLPQNSWVDLPQHHKTFVTSFSCLKWPNWFVNNIFQNMMIMIFKLTNCNHIIETSPRMCWLHFCHYKIAIIISKHLPECNDYHFIMLKLGRQLAN